MSWVRWAFLIAGMTVLGLLQVHQRTALWIKSYDVGRSLAASHDAENDAAWVTGQILALESPGHLARTMTQRKLNMTARSVLAVE